MIEEKRFKIIINTPTYINAMETDSLDSALNKMQSMIGKIEVKFIDKELDKHRILKNVNDYKTLLNEY